jgi:hypothetical protein
MNLEHEDMKFGHKLLRTKNAGRVAMLSTATVVGTFLFLSGTPAKVGAAPGELPTPPADGVMGFVVDKFMTPLVPGMDACPEGLTRTLRESYLEAQPDPERQRLSLKENEEELTRNWKALATGPGGTNMCSQPDRFDRPIVKTVQSKTGWGLDLDNGGGSCGHEEFTTPAGEAGIDNQEYRALGCLSQIRGRDGNGGEQLVGLRQFFASGEWTQVLLLRGVDSLKDDSQVEVIYANTPDRPPQDSKGEFLRGASFTISDKAPRNRNVLKGKIVAGVLTTEPQDIILTQTWGQGSPRDIRGYRTKYTYRMGRLKLTINPDGSLSGFVGGYRPVFEPIQSAALGGIGAALTGGIDCAGQYATLRKLADGFPDPKTGKCTAVSSAMRVNAIPAFVNDAPPASKEQVR